MFSRRFDTGIYYFEVEEGDRPMEIYLGLNSSSPYFDFYFDFSSINNLQESLLVTEIKNTIFCAFDNLVPCGRYPIFNLFRQDKNKKLVNFRETSFFPLTEISIFNDTGKVKTCFIMELNGKKIKSFKINPNDIYNLSLVLKKGYIEIPRILKCDNKTVKIEFFPLEEYEEGEG